MSIEKFLELEKKYNLKSLRCDDQQIWTFLRGYVAFKYLDKEKKHNPVTGFKMSYLKTLLLGIFFSIPDLFRKYNYWSFTDTNRRVQYNNKYFDYLVDPINSILDRNLVIERPNPRHYSRKKNHSKYIISKFVLFLYEGIYKCFHSPSEKIVVENENTLISFLREIGTTINYKELIIKHQIQEKCVDFLIKIFGKPKVVFVAVAYNNMGYIKKLKALMIPVVELQHGLVSESHHAYHVEETLDSNYYPDYFFSFSSNTLMSPIYTKSHYFKKIVPYEIGNFLIQNSVDIHKRDHLKSKGDRILATTQDFYGEGKFLELLIIYAQRNPLRKLTFKTRNKSKYYYLSKYKLPKNIKVDDESALYELFKSHDIHCTVYSTCALEAGRCGIPNILININGLHKHITGIVGDRRYFGIANNYESFKDLVEEYSFVDKSKVYESNLDIYMDDYSVRLKKAIEQISE